MFAPVLGIVAGTVGGRHIARNPRASRLETRTARLKLPVRWKPYDFTTISPGIALGYRRNQAAGVWVVRVANGKGGHWTKRVAIADDFEEADGEHVLTWFQAIETARKLARGQSDRRPGTVAEAINLYEHDLIARSHDTANAKRIRKHVTAALAAKPVALLTATDLAHWRDALLAGKLERSSVRRVCRSLAAALSLAAHRDHRIRNETAWRHGLGGIGDSFGTRNAQVLTDQQVHAVVVAAYAESAAFGLYIETAAVTGARLSQLARLNVADLQADNGTPRLLMPSSRKGRGQRATTHKPVPITPALAVKLTAAAAGRAAGAPLLLRADGLRWQTNDVGDHLRGFANAARAAGTIIDGKPVTAYALRHSSIIRSLLANVPIRVVAATHDTSVVMIERTYSAFIADHADAVARPALLELA